MNKKYRVLLSLLSSFLLTFLVGRFVLAEDSTFEFPTCQSRWGQKGDIAHYTDGFHQILEGDLLEGSDDVYSLEGNNYLQCYCATDEKSGIQTWWWRIGS